MARLLTARAPKPHGLAGQLLATLTHGSVLRPERIRTPTLVVRGEHDALVPRAHTRLLAQRIPRAEAVEVPTAGHLYLHERPDEAFALFTAWVARRVDADPTGNRPRPPARA